MSRHPFGNQRGEVIPGATLRTDAWWIEPVLVILLLGGFAVYATWAALQNAHYYVAPYLSPFYSPCLSTSCQHVTLPLIGAWWRLTHRRMIRPCRSNSQISVPEERYHRPLSSHHSCS